MNKKRISLTIDSNILENIDKIRGYVSRSAFINKLLEENLTFQTASELLGMDSK